MEALAKIKTLRLSSRKAALVARQIRFQSVAQALSVLENSNQKAARFFLKLLNSAVANAVNNHGLDASRLVVKEVIVNEGPTLKRYQPHSRGRASAILKRTTHLTIKVKEN